MEDRYHWILYNAGHLFFTMLVRWLVLPWSVLWHDDGAQSHHHDQKQQQHSLSAQVVRDTLRVTTYGEITATAVAAGGTECSGSTCAVCLNKMRSKDKLWELRNCNHVFHKGCLDRWLDHDDHLTCPLCRAPLVLPPSASSAPSEPSWAVERLLYLFGDDLLFSSCTTPISVQSSS